MTDTDEIKRRTETIRKEIPDYVDILGAAKTRTIEEVQAAFEGGVSFFGHNYVQEAQAMIPGTDIDVKWHMIGHLQRNKARSAVQLFDMVESIDSLRLAKEMEKRCAEIQKSMPVLIEVNTANEVNKTGLMLEEVGEVVEWISEQTYIHLVGVMTMGPMTGDPEMARPYFRKARDLFGEIGNRHLPNTDMYILSMGMSNSYRVAIEEGANLVRLGTVIFGPRSS